MREDVQIHSQMEMLYMDNHFMDRILGLDYYWTDISCTQIIPFCYAHTSELHSYQECGCCS